jgi:hypothetical protein
MTLKKQAAKVRKAGYKNSGQDSILAHITPEEAMRLKMAGGSGRPDPHTGLPHFDAGDGSPSGDGGFGGDAGFGLSDGYGGAGFGDSDGFGVGDMGGSVTAPDMSFNPVSMDDFSLPSIDTAQAPSNSFSLSSIFGKSGKQAALNALGALGIPGLSASIASATAPNTGAATGAMGQGFLGMLGSALGSVGGPVGSMAGGFLGSQAGQSFGSIPGMSESDTASALGGMAPGVSPGEGYQRAMGPGGGFGNGSVGGGDFFKNFLTSYASQGMNELGNGLGGMFGGGGNQQPMASYPPGAQSNSSNLYSMLTGQAQPEMSTPWNSMQTAAPNMDGSSAGNFSPTGGEYTQPNATPQGFSMPTAGQVGNFAGNNMGTLLTGLYSLYNNNKMRNQIGNQMQGLQGLYSAGSPYAKQLEAKIAANAAARGTRSNVAGRDVQLQAALADKAASMAPNMFQMQQAQNGLQSSQMNDVLKMMRDTGLMKSLGNMFTGGN